MVPWPARRWGRLLVIQRAVREAAEHHIVRRTCRASNGPRTTHRTAAPLCQEGQERGYRNLENKDHRFPVPVTLVWWGRTAALSHLLSPGVHPCPWVPAAARAGPTAERVVCTGELFFLPQNVPLDRKKAMTLAISPRCSWFAQLLSHFNFQQCLNAPLPWQVTAMQRRTIDLLYKKTRETRHATPAWGTVRRKLTAMREGVVY